VCLEVCPFTRFAERGSATSMRADLRRPHAVVDTFTLIGVLELSAQDYATRWTGTAMRRATRQGLRRNAATVLGNRGDPAAIPALCRALDDQDPVVRAHAAWALGRIDHRVPALANRLRKEADDMVAAELRAALAQTPRETAGTE
jgi:epoxyqueuosine reductase